MKKNVTIRHELIPTLKLALPMTITQLLGFSQQIIDTVMAGQHNNITLSGVALANQLFALIYLIVVGTGIGLSALISGAQGRNDYVNIRKYFQQGIWLFLFLAAITTFTTYICSYLPGIIGSEPVIAYEAKRYLIALSFPAGLFIFATCIRYFYEGMSYPRMNNYIQAALLPVNAIGNYIFLKYTSLEALGMAISTGISYFLYMLIIFFSVYKSKRWRAFRLFKAFGVPQWKIMKKIVKIGLPIGVAISMEAGLFNIMGMLISRTNAVNTGANQIVMNYTGSMFMIPLGIASALTIRTANAHARNDWEAIRARALGGILICTFIMICSGIFMISERGLIAQIYTSDAQTLIIASKLLIITAIFQLFDGIQISAAGVLRGIGDTRITLLYALIGYWFLGFPIGLIMSYSFELGIYGLWGGICIGLFVFSCLALQRVFKHLRFHLKRE